MKEIIQYRRTREHCGIYELLLYLEAEEGDGALCEPLMPCFLWNNFIFNVGKALICLVIKAWLYHDDGMYRAAVVRRNSISDGLKRVLENSRLDSI